MQTFSLVEAAEYLKIPKDILSESVRKGELTPSRDTNKRGKPYVFSQDQLDEYLKNMAVYRPASWPPAGEPEQPNDVELLQDMIKSVFHFLDEHRFTLSIKSLQEIDASTLRLYEIKTPDTFFKIIVSGSNITMLSEGYVQELEQKVKVLQQELESTQTSLLNLLITQEEEESPLEEEKKEEEAE
jgi:excisionase family DNA binding protein